MTDDISIFKDQIREAVRLGNVERNLSEIEQVDIPLQHHFAGGIYVREILIPANTIVLGKRHRLASCNFLVSGELSLYMGEGIPSKRVRGPMIFESAPGTRKLVYSHSDVVFMNFHPTEEVDLEIIEREFIIPDHEYIDKKNAELWLSYIKGEKQCLGQQ
jgi:hypothetical protein